MKVINGLVFAIGLFLLGCGTPPPPSATQIGKDTYTDNSSSRTSLLSKASYFCKYKGLHFKLLRERTFKDQFGNQISIDYKCLNENSQEYIDGSNYEVPDNVIINNTEYENQK